ncbi:hypothetical protein [Streptomyces sp. NPDC048637]|uniref:hypothetical protein n=1 Tax=Streptomyces sp. NPDC048637 TaxID=3155636 RepID=UPI0034133F0E
MYNASLPNLALNAGVPAAAMVTAAGAWNQVTGMALLLLGAIAVFLSLRARRQLTRTFL